MNKPEKEILEIMSIDTYTKLLEHEDAKKISRVGKLDFMLDIGNSIVKKANLLHRYKL